MFYVTYFACETALCMILNLVNLRAVCSDKWSNASAWHISM